MALDGVLLPFAPARPALPVLFRFAKRHGARTPEESLKLKADHVTKPFLILFCRPYGKGWII